MAESLTDTMPELTPEHEDDSDPTPSDHMMNGDDLPKTRDPDFTITNFSNTSLTIKLNGSQSHGSNQNQRPKRNAVKTEVFVPQTQLKTKTNKKRKNENKKKNKKEGAVKVKVKVDAKTAKNHPITAATFAQSQKPDLEEITPETPLRPSGRTADWDKFLRNGDNLCAIPPVNWFKHAPLSDVWNGLARLGRVIEVPNPFIRCSRPIYWIGTVVHFAGYKALVEFESFDYRPNYMAWMSFCSKIPKPIGWSDKNRVVLLPPPEVRKKYPEDYLERAREMLWMNRVGTITDRHGDDVREDIQKCQKYPLNTNLEVLDCTNIGRMRVARVTCLVGDRIHVTYVNPSKENDAGFWFNVNSAQVHPLGWSQTVGHEIYDAPDPTKCVPLNDDYFPKYPAEINLCPGQFLEVRHPSTRKICAGVIQTVLKHGYFVVQMQVLPVEVNFPTRFTYHVTSPYVYHCGFWEQFGHKILPPYGENEEKFNWDDYARRFNIMKAPLHLLPPRPSHSFKPGMKIEGVDVTLPTYLGPCTILKVVAHMLYIHFDGWRRDSTVDMAEIWVDAESPDIYPIGYAEMVGHEYQGCVEKVSAKDMAALRTTTATATISQDTNGHGQMQNGMDVDDDSDSGSVSDMD